MSRSLYLICRQVLMVCLPLVVHAQNVVWTIQSPLPNASVAKEELFISLRINESYHFGSESQVKVFLNNNVVTGNVKISGNKLHMLYSGPLLYGKNAIRVEAFVVELNEVATTEWSFLVAGAADDEQYEPELQKQSDYSLTGSVVMDYRKQFLSGPGQSLRQEPLHTATTFIDATARYKNASMPIRMFMSTNNTDARQTMNYFSVGFRNTWVETDLGDLNPTYDELILTGVRVRGGRLMLKYRGNSIQVVHGQMNNAFEGSVENYVPGTGTLPGALVNDSQYVAPGVYKRTMSAARLQVGPRNEDFRLGLTAFHAKDDTASIQYGLLPKQNIVGGLDLGVKGFNKTVEINAGVALSVFTNDISNGPLDKETLDTTYNIKLDLDPKDYEDIIILNASTVPTTLDNTDFIAYFGRLTYNNKYQNFLIEYKKNGALYHSLGNPFLRNNYEGIMASEKFSLFKRKVSVGLIYQNYSNNLNSSLPSTVMTQSYRGNLFLNIKQSWPMLYLNYMRQNRDGKSEYANIVGIDDVLDNYMANLSYSRSFWNIDHYVFLVFNMFDRKDQVRVDNRIKAMSFSFGLNESFSKYYNVTGEIGKTIIRDVNSSKVSDILTYSLGFNWLVKPEKYTVSVLLSNNKTYATTLSSESYRLSGILRFGWTFWRGMNLSVEGGYQPFRDATVTTNNYNDSYIYIRYSSDLNRLFQK